MFGAAGGKTLSSAWSASSSAFSAGAVSTNTEIDLKSVGPSTGGDIASGERAPTAARATPPRGIGPSRREGRHVGAVNVPHAETSGGGGGGGGGLVEIVSRRALARVLQILLFNTTGVAVLGVKTLWPYAFNHPTPYTLLKNYCTDRQ